ncbi:MAG: hypothetical protein ACFCU8_01200 [Thermosynechococcaceae cyanobacterium]
MKTRLFSLLGAMLMLGATSSASLAQSNSSAPEELSPAVMKILCERFPLNSRCAGKDQGGAAPEETPAEPQVETSTPDSEPAITPEATPESTAPESAAPEPSGGAELGTDGAGGMEEKGTMTEPGAGVSAPEAAPEAAPEPTP